ncbi:radical SAM protein [Anatilimnocola sp. NA78]|uniref:radical SAM protein n=1 Tax=Anatilimnocola sp. NA78 TaxID=3415683 RepID=UPI003CE4DD22
MALDVLHTQHQRRFAESKFVYPVLSRRSGGISLGVNLNPDKVCNFDCIYCQVDRTTQSDTRFVELPRMLDELDHFLKMVTSGELYETEKFSHTPPHLRRLNDIAFSGDGEPTTHRNFDEIVTAAAALKKQHGLDNVKLVLITNASMFHRPHVQRGLEILDQNNGEIWAKLEAGTEAYFKLIDRTPISLQQIVDNITTAAKVRPLVIQSLFMRVAGEPPTAAEFDAFCDRLNEITAAGGKLSLIQIYTVARKPTESYVTPLTDAEVDALVARVQERTRIPAQAFYGANSDAIKPSKES